MEIHRKRTIKARIPTVFHHWKYPVFALLLFLAGTALGLFCFYLGAQAHRQHGFRGQFTALVRDVMAAYQHVPLNYLRSFFVAPDEILIDMKFKHLQRMAFNREVALDAETIADSLKQIEYPAEISHKSGSYRGKITLYGYWLDHVNSQKFSMRVKLRDGAVFGMRKFILMHPKVRYGLYDWTAHQLMKAEGLLSLRYKFVRVRLNGENKGIYIMEENYDSRLVENNRLREGIIFKPASPIMIYGEKALAADPARKPALHLARNLYTAYTQSDLAPEQFFDYDKLARFLSVVKLVGGEHALLEDNIRFYLNPVTGRVEPIGREFDIKPTAQQSAHNVGFFTPAMEDPAFQKKYISNLKRLSEKEYLDGFFEDIDAELRRNSRLIQREYPYHALSKAYFYSRQIAIKSELQITPGDFKAYYSTGADSIKIRFISASMYPVQITHVDSDSESFNKLFMKEVLSKIYRNGDRVEIRIPDGDLPAVLDGIANKMAMSYQIAGSGFERTSSILPLSRDAERRIDVDKIRRPGNLGAFRFIKVDERSREILIRVGEWDIAEDLIIPSGYVVRAGPGTRLNLENGASIVSRSPLLFTGVPTKPIVIASRKNTGQGVLVLNTKDASSVMSHVKFMNLSAPNDFGWNLTGAVTVYESDAAFDGCTFSGNRDSDDALNIIRSSFSITRSEFIRTFADAVDIDFSQGTISDTTFQDCGSGDKNGDCMDFSGSTVLIKNILVRGAGDKAVSAGEKSRVLADELLINDAHTAIASKDMSSVEIGRLDANNCGFGIAVYQKKPEFGPAGVVVNNFSNSGIGVLYVVESRSTLRVMGEDKTGFFAGDIEELVSPSRASKPAQKGMR